MFTLRQVATDLHANCSLCCSPDGGVYCLASHHCDWGDGHPSGIHNWAHRRIRVWTSIYPIIRRRRYTHRQFHETKTTATHEVPLLVFLLSHLHHGPVPRSHLRHDDRQRGLHRQWHRLIRWLILLLRFIQFYGNKQERLDDFEKSLLTRFGNAFGNLINSTPMS
ncbi:unnamed protein product [Chrysodeixis includens]|uniref:Uncharacterized protein n=1 Tax=Chrysodeixis includens TaxID=689277 RepID=A0A9P0FRT1_CHRIL|nr:unnamed protein product [Chrysodeixis includens]